MVAECGEIRMSAPNGSSFWPPPSAARWTPSGRRSTIATVAPFRREALGRGEAAGRAGDNGNPPRQPARAVSIIFSYTGRTVALKNGVHSNFS